MAGGHKMPQNFVISAQPIGRKKVTPTKKKNNFNYRKILTNALRILVKNPFKESNTNKKDIIGL